MLVRWLGIGVAVLSLPFLHLGLRMWGVVLGATLYKLVFQFYILPHRPGVLTRGCLTTAGDALLSAAAVFATGGLRSEFFLIYFIYFLVAVVAAIRFGGTAALVSTGVRLVLDGGGQQFDPRIVAALAGLVTQRLSAPETASQAAGIAGAVAG